MNRNKNQVNYKEKKTFLTGASTIKVYYREMVTANFHPSKNSVMCWDASNNSSSKVIGKMTSATATMYPFMESSFKLDPAATTTASHNSYSGYTLPASSQPGSHGVGQPQIVPSPSTNPHAYHHAASVAASGLYDPHRMFNGLNGLHSNPDPFPGLHDPMQSWAAQHHMAQHSNQMYPTYMNGMSAHHAAVASAAASASPAGAFFRYMRSPGSSITGGLSTGGMCFSFLLSVI